MVIGPRCTLCKKQRTYHHERTNACPVGKLSLEQFHDSNTFTPKPPRVRQARIPKQSKRGGSEKRKNRELRKALKSEPCAACGTMGADWNPVDPAHIRTFKVTQSDHPANLIPLCRQCHRYQHAWGWHEFLTGFPDVARLLVKKGWRLDGDPFDGGRLVLSHPEVA